MAKYFKIEELLRSDTATRKNIDNTPNAELRKNLENLMDQLDIIREAYGAPIRITSGFRSWDLNKAVGGSTTSQHAAGQAADMVGYDNLKLWDTILKLNKLGRLNWTQLIDEKNLQWVHIGIDPKNLKNQILTIK